MSELSKAAQIHNHYERVWQNACAIALFHSVDLDCLCKAFELENVFINATWDPGLDREQILRELFMAIRDGVRMYDRIPRR